MAGVAVKTEEIAVQVKLFALVAPAVGATIFCVTVTALVEVQPLVVLVTVTVKVPGAVVVAVAPVPKLLDQLYVTPVAGVAASVALGVVQVTVAGLAVAVAVGGVLFTVTVTERVVEQPFVPVTVTV